MAANTPKQGNNGDKRQARRGYAAPLTAVLMVTILGFVAFGVDMGMLFAAKGELQRTADAAALSAALELLSEERLRGPDYQEGVFNDAKDEAAGMAAENPVRGATPIVVPGEDVSIGILNSLKQVEPYSNVSEADEVNAVEVTVRRDADRGGSIELYFGSFLGLDSKDIQVAATAAFEKDIAGFEVTDPNGQAMLLPFALHEDYWNQLIAGTYSTGDHYAFDSATHTISAGSDGVPEINLYPAQGSGQLPPGNLGTVDIGPSSNSSQDIARQILDGVNADDLSYFGGSIMLDAQGEFFLEGDTGLGAGFKEELEEVKDRGDCRIIPLFKSVASNGNNSVYTCTGWAGIQICHVKLTGPMKKKKVVIQPAYCMDPTAVPGSHVGSSTYVFTPPRLVN